MFINGLYYLFIIFSWNLENKTYNVISNFLNYYYYSVMWPFHEITKSNKANISNNIKYRKINKNIRNRMNKMDIKKDFED